jgi:uncharacterized protein with gpF-like domain
MTIDDGLLAPKPSVERRAVVERHAAELGALYVYADPPAAAAGKLSHPVAPSGLRFRSIPVVMWRAHQLR